MSYLDELMGAGDAHGLRRTNPTNQPMTNTTSRTPGGTTKPSAWSNYLSGSLEGLARAPRELAANVRDMISRYGETAAQVGAGMLPGAGYVQASQDFARGKDALLGGEYGTAAANYGQGAANTVLETVAPYLPSLAMAAAPATHRARQLMEVSGDYARAQGGQTGLKTGYSKVKHSMPFEDMTRTVADDPHNVIAPFQEADLAKMVGGYGFPLVGDRTEAGKILTEINGTPLYHGGTKLEGGFQYGQSAASRGPNRSGWASHAEPITTLSNRLERLHKMADGRPVYGIFSGMGERAGDFSTMNADALLGLVPASGMGANAMGGFDEMLAARLAKDGADPAMWPGLQSLERAREALMSRSGGELRKAFMETADSGAARELGMPDVAAVRKATTHPDLLDWRGAGPTGSSIIQFQPGGKPVRNPSIEHGTYPSQYPGEYVGGLRTPVDRNEFFPRTVHEQFQTPRGNGDPRTWANVDRAFMTNAGLVEKLDQQWLDTVMQAYQRRLANGR